MLVDACVRARLKPDGWDACLRPPAAAAAAPRSGSPPRPLPSMQEGCRREESLRQGGVLLVTVAMIGVVLATGEEMSSNRYVRDDGFEA